jgi:glycosyltransferase involved in cell wall biosynthesis
MLVIPNGIDLQEIEARAAQPAKGLPTQATLTILIPATLNPNKNQGMALRGLARYMERGGSAALWLAGDFTTGITDTYAASLQRLAQDLGIAPCVHFLGWRSDVPAVMARADIVALTSRNEGMPRVLIEAMALRKPLLATKVGGIPEVIRHGVDGFLVDLDNDLAFADGLTRLAQPAIRVSLGQAGRERVEELYDIRATAARVYAALSDLADGRPPPAGGKAGAE